MGDNWLNGGEEALEQEEVMDGTLGAEALLGEKVGLAFRSGKDFHSGYKRYY